MKKMKHAEEDVERAQKVLACMTLAEKVRLTPEQMEEVYAEHGVEAREALRDMKAAQEAFVAAYKNACVSVCAMEKSIKRTEHYKKTSAALEAAGVDRDDVESLMLGYVYTPITEKPEWAKIVHDLLGCEYPTEYTKEEFRLPVTDDDLSDIFDVD